ncbi:hypothetical protein D9X91_19500 [Falsibacillus albus]|uniref:Uncharacterized protein n=2 Tax=Falsibacillus albus TaxID=2478915 RepID=A0A3L7JPL9_9BACI|nr:hypothetical protein D9X91_19500 [Falsibacillus albus]
MYIAVFAAQVIGGAIALAVFSSIHMNNRTKGFVSLAIIILGMIYSVFQGFTLSQTMGIGMTFIYLFLFAVTYFIQRRKKESGIIS